MKVNDKASRPSPIPARGLLVIGTAIGGILIAGGKAGTPWQVLVAALVAFFVLGLVWLVIAKYESPMYDSSVPGSRDRLSTPVAGVVRIELNIPALPEASPQGRVGLGVDGDARTESDLV